MRLDKYLKLTRLIKRREVAKVLINESSILVNNKIVKPSYEVNINDEIKLKLGRRVIVIQVKDIQETVKKQNCGDLYTIIKDTLTTN